MNHDDNKYILLYSESMYCFPAVGNTASTEEESPAF